MKLLLGIALPTLIISGCSTPSPIKSINRMPLASELQSASKPDEIIARASKDIELLRANENPQYSIFRGGLYDGGTRFFEGAGYQITDHREIATRNGQNGFIQGQSILFERAVTGGDIIKYSNTTFAPSGK